VKIFSPTILCLHCPFTPVEPGYRVDLFEDDYLFPLPAADLRMDPALRPLPASSLTSVTLYNTYIGFPLRHPLDCANRNMFFNSTYTAEYLATHRDFFIYLHVEQFVFVFLFLFFVAWGGLGEYGGG
jgi:hypothetical protein